MKSVCVFCASSPGDDPVLMATARALGAELARRNIKLIYGGARVGLMGAVADGALEAGGQVIGVLPKFLSNKEVAHAGLTRLILVESMHQRKMKMFELSDGFIALPGGFGTLEEVTEILTWQQLGLHKRPIGFLNVAGFYDHLLRFFDHMENAKVLRTTHRTMALSAPTCEELLKQMQAKFVREAAEPRIESWTERSQQANTPSKRKSLPLTLAALFLFFWCAFGTFIKTNDLADYTLQQMGVDALVNHHTFQLGLSRNPHFMPGSDTFNIEGKSFAAKQPGQFVWGALAYAPLKLFGIDYDRDYVQATAYVTFFCGTLFAALMVTALFYLLYYVWSFSFNGAMLATVAAAFGTTYFPYTSVLHHDVIATALIVFSFTCTEANRLRKSRWLFFAAGVFGGLSVFTSMLGALVIGALALCEIGSSVSMGLSTGLALELAWYCFGWAAGLLPLLIYNHHYFGAPLTQANVAGHFADTYFHPTLEQFAGHLHDYFGTGYLSVWMYAPIACLGFLFAAKLARKGLEKDIFRRVVLISLVHVAYILNIKTYGDCQFGPRYLLPLMPFWCLALAPIWDSLSKQRIWGAISRRLLVLGVLASSLINLSGALIGTMQCALWEWLPQRYWGRMPWPTPETFPMFLLSVPAELILILFLVKRIFPSLKLVPWQKTSVTKNS